jgi:hypothetical protein
MIYVLQIYIHMYVLQICITNMTCDLVIENGVNFTSSTSLISQHWEEYHRVNGIIWTALSQ